MTDTPRTSSQAPIEASSLVSELSIQPSDILITKRHWSAFLNTDLELSLREKGVQTIVIGGISTNLHGDA